MNIPSQRTGGTGLCTCALLATLAILTAAPGCRTGRGSLQQRAASAQYAFNQVVRLYHVPAGEEKDEAKRAALLKEAADGYRSIVRRFPDQPRWAAQALRSLGHVYESQGKSEDALACYDRVGRDYPNEDWEVIQAWKSAADMLWDAGQKERAANYFDLIVRKYDDPDLPPMFETLVRIAKSRLGIEYEP